MSVTRSVLRRTQQALVWFGVAALMYVGSTVSYAEIAQRYQAWKFDRVMANGPVTAVSPSDATELHEGDLIGRLRIERLGLSVMVLHGVEPATLVAGAGHVPGTPLPGVAGNVSIAAHRDTFFRALKGIVPGDRIQVTTERGNYAYRVEGTDIVGPDETWVMESRDRPELTLITCYPFDFIGAAPRRFIVHARLLQWAPATDATLHVVGSNP
jgi:sortase A